MKKIGRNVITNIENTQNAETGDGGVVNAPLPDYAEPQKGSEAEESAAATSSETVEE